MFNLNVASLTSLKLNAVKDVVPSHYTIKGYDSKSGIDEQPLGLSMIKEGALNRLNSISNLPAVSFETGMVETNNGYFDITCTILRTHLGDFYSLSPLQKCPESEIKEWLSLDNNTRKNTTLGSIIAYKYCTIHTSSISKNDWYKEVGSQLSRQEVLSKTFEEVWYEYVRNLQSMPTLIPKVVKYNNVDFIDIQHNLLKQPQDLTKAIRLLANHLIYNVIVVADARGFLLAGEFMKEKIPIVMARKKNKLPTEVETITYDKEYGTDEISIELGAIPKGSRVLIIDDILATGGTMLAIEKLVHKFDSEVVAFITPFAIEKEPGQLLCDKIPLDKVRFAQTQLMIPKWEFKETLNISNEIAIIPPSLNSFKPNNRANIRWDRFTSSSNIKFMSEELAGKDVKVYVNMLNQTEAFDVLSLLSILYRKDPKSISVIVPFMEQGTQDRIEYDDTGMETLAQIDTIGKIFGKNKVTTFDLHAEQSIVAFYDLRNMSIVKVLWDKYHELNPNSVPVFPDDGSAKRFGKLLGVIENKITFRKTRGAGDIRIVTTDDDIKDGQSYVLIDDLVRTGSTMYNVAKFLLDRKAKTVDALFAHAPFDPLCAKYFHIFNDVWTSNSCPDKVPSQWVKSKF